MNILVVGSQGQLGQALQTELLAHNVVGVDLPQFDITDYRAVQRMVKLYGPDLVINAAAYTNVDGAEKEIDLAYRANALGPRNLALATAQARITLLHVSTDYVFDGTAVRPYHEFDQPNPLGVYGASKLAGEQAVQMFNPQHYVVRPAWLYHHVGKNFARTICALATQPAVRVVNDQIGSPTYAPHLAQGIGTLIETGAYGTYHVAGRGTASWFELTQALYRHMGITTPVIPIRTDEFHRPTPRPKFSALTTLQDPCIVLPTWENGVQAFARECQTNPIEVG